MTVDPMQEPAPDATIHLVVDDVESDQSATTPTQDEVEPDGDEDGT